MSITAKTLFQILLDRSDERQFIGRGAENIISTTVNGGQSLVFTQVIAASASALIFDGPNTKPMANFDLLALLPDQSGYIEFVVDDNGDVGKVVQRLALLANFPFILGSDAAYAIAGGVLAEDFADGTVDTIDEIRVKNSSASASMNLKIMMGSRSDA